MLVVCSFEGTAVPLHSGGMMHHRKRRIHKSCFTVHWLNNANIGARRICEGVIKAEEISVTELDLADLTLLSVFLNSNH